MPTPLEVWCRQARELLGTVRGDKRVSGISNKELRQIRHDFEATELLLRNFAAAYPARAGVAQKLIGQYGSLVGKLDKAGDGDTTRSLHQDVKDLNEQVKDQLGAARAALRQGWDKQLARVPALQARDALLTLGWIDRDLDRVAVDTTGDWDQQIGRVRAQVGKAREGVTQRLEQQARDDVARWGREIKAAESLSGGALLAEIDRIEDERRALKANFTDCKLPVPSTLDQLPLETLHELYAKGFPARTEGATASKYEPKAQDAPKFERDDDEGIADMLKFYASELVQMNWFTLKKNYKAGKVTDKQMQQAWAFRQKVVDGYMQRIERQYGLVKGKGWKAVGSVTMESDIDVSILDHHWDAKNEKVLTTDAAIVKEFNDWFLGTYGAQPGIMFDVNLYASAPPRKKLPDVNSATPVQKAMIAMANAGQDVGALMKMRRYMSWEEYAAYQQDVVDAMADGGASDEDLRTTVKQFEEADSLYQISLAESLNKAKALIEKRVAEHQKDPAKPVPTPEQLKALKMIGHELEAASKATGAEAQKILAHAAHELEEMADVNMWVNNELYTEGVAEVRRLEEKADQLQKEVDQLPLERQADSKPAKELAGVVARLKTLATDSVFFANEAYHSEGPFQHIVVATQGVKSDLERDLGHAPTKDEIDAESKRRRDGLSVHLVLQSFNEQLGDLLKDLKHYAGESNPGVGLYRSSKYLQRLLDSLGLLQAKIEGIELGFDPVALSKSVDDTVLAARKGNIQFAGVAGAEALERESQAYAIEQMDKLFGVKTLGQLAGKFKDVGATVNAKARKALAAEMRDAKEQEKAYFPP